MLPFKLIYIKLYNLINKIKSKAYYYTMTINTINTIIGDWGLGIGDWAQSPIPNPQSPN